MKPALRAVEPSEEAQTKPLPCAECKKRAKEIRELQKQIDRMQRALQRESYTYESPRIHDGRKP